MLITGKEVAKTKCIVLYKTDNEHSSLAVKIRNISYCPFLKKPRDANLWLVT